MRLLELLLIRGFLWVGLPLLLVVLAVGPGRFWNGVQRGWAWLWRKRLAPEEVLTQVVTQYQLLVEALNKTLAKSEAVEADLARHIARSEENIAALEKEAQKAAKHNDDLGARAALYKLDLEKQAVANFREQRERQRHQIADVRKHLYLVELQLRQYEVGRTILLSQLAEAQTVEQQYQIASQFDPYSAVANWKQAEGIIQDKALSARAIELVHNDLAKLELEPPVEGAAPAPAVDPAELDAELQRLKNRVRQAERN